MKLAGMETESALGREASYPASQVAKHQEDSGSLPLHEPLKDCRCQQAAVPHCTDAKAAMQDLGCKWRAPTLVLSSMGIVMVRPTLGSCSGSWN